ncbi:Glycosyltransferase LafA, responsible for the formation of Glc-DAG [Clostridiaceae bacterium JG1575]|nr:Glycosyltransferase LafA, responsible for the formation of Glc-DAG [Clostridiaceae bacterium JG1575]
MRVLITSDWFAPTVNGVVTSILNLQEQLEAHGHEVKILTLKQKEAAESEACVYEVPSFSAGVLYPGARIMRTLGTQELKEIREWGPDLIHTQCEFSTFVLAQMIASKLDIPIVHTYHTVYEDYVHYFSANAALGRSLVRKFSQNVLHRVDRVVVPTRKVETLLEGYGVETPISIVPTGIDLSRFTLVDPDEREALRSSFKVAPEELLLVFLGRLAKEKNIEEIMAFLHELPAGIRLAVVGGGPYKKVLESFVAQENLGDRVIFTGMVQPEEVARYYQMADVFVSASTSETQGLTYVEALAAGLPSICRKDACLEEVLYDGVNGWQYETKEEFLTAVMRLKQDPLLRQSMALQAVDIAQRYSKEAFYEGIIKVYELTLESPPRRKEPLSERLLQKIMPGGAPFEGL